MAGKKSSYDKLDLAEVPVLLVKDGNKEVLIQVALPERTVFARIWKVQVGRVPLYLMDTDIPQNVPDDRELTARLYDSDPDKRISQEIVLGIGGVRALRALGIRPAVWHMNEGHSAFLGLERARELVEARPIVRRGPARGAGQRALHHAHAGPGRERRLSGCG